MQESEETNVEKVSFGVCAVDCWVGGCEVWELATEFFGARGQKAAAELVMRRVNEYVLWRIGRE